VNTNEQWCVVVKTRLGAHRLVLGGEVDCIHASGLPWPRPPTPVSLSSLVELKTHIMPRRGNERDEQMFNRKTMRVWTQSFLLGVPEVMFGMRSPRGRVESVRRFRTEEFPRRVRGRRVGDTGAWSPDVLLGWGGKALDAIRGTIERDGMEWNHKDGQAKEEKETEEDEETKKEEKEGREKDRVEQDKEKEIWRVEFRPGKGMRMFKLGKEMEEDVQADPDVIRIGVLPKWFWDANHADSSST
jgi:RAT1-interacting protein